METLKGGPLFQNQGTRKLSQTVSQNNSSDGQRKLNPCLSCGGLHWPISKCRMLYLHVGKVKEHIFQKSADR